MLERLDRLTQRQFSEVALRRFPVGEAKRECSLSFAIDKAGEAHRRIPRKDDFPFAVCRQRVCRGIKQTGDGIDLVVFIVKDSRERRAESVFAHLPTVCHTERRRVLWRTEVAAVPESGEVELAVGVRRAGRDLLSEVEIDVFLGGYHQGDAAGRAVAFDFLEETDRERTVARPLIVVGRAPDFAERQHIVRRGIAGCLQRKAGRDIGRGIFKSMQAAYGGKQGHGVRGESFLFLHGFLI